MFWCDMLLFVVNGRRTTENMRYQSTDLDESVPHNSDNNTDDTPPDTSMSTNTLPNESVSTQKKATSSKKRKKRKPSGDMPSSSPPQHAALLSIMPHFLLGFNTEISQYLHEVYVFVYK